MPPVNLTSGQYPLSSVADLPNVTVAFRGEHWSNRYASGAITPGEAVVPVASAGKLYMRKATAADAALREQLAIAMRPVDIPDANTGPSSVGPNQIKNQPLQHGEYVHAQYSGAFHLTLVRPDATYAPGDLIGWMAAGPRPTGKPGTGSWAKNAQADLDSVFEVMEWRPFNVGGTEGILTVRSLRGQF